jgi:PKD repeat protein
MTRTYLVQTNGVNPTFNALIYNTNTSYPISGSNSSFSHTYPQPGYYQVRVIVSGTNCLDTLLVTDTISGQLNCAALTHSMTASSSGQIGYFYLSGAATAPYPGYTRNVSYNYGDGTSGTSSNHSYTASGNYLTTATTTLSHPTYSTCTIVDTVTIQVTLPPNRIYASARWDSSLNAAGASMKFWLIQYDSTSQTLTAVDSALVAIAGGYTTSTIFNNEPVGSYRVKAHMLNQPASWTTHLLPTYGRSAAYWQNASTFRHNGFTSFSSVLMQQGAATSGPGFIGGLVTQGANRGGAAGDPMPNTTMILRDQSGVPVASTLTDAQGQYRFTNLAYSTYTVYPEALNYATTPSQAITLDATQPAAQGYNFRQELVARTFDPYFVPASVGNTTTALGVLVYPNPAQQTLYVRLADQAVSGTLEVYNLMGQRVKAQVIDLTQPLQELSTEGLANGTYLLHLPTAEGRQIHKIAVQH